MSVIADLAANNQAAMAVAGVLEQALGGDVILTVGRPRMEAPSADVLPGGLVRVATAEFTTGLSGSVSVVVNENAARALEAVAPDEELLTSLGPVVAEAATIIGGLVEGGARAADPVETSPSDLVTDLPPSHEFLIYPLLDGGERIACFVVHLSADEASEPGEAPPPSGAAAGGVNVSSHEFEQLRETTISLVDPRPLSILHEVEMGVTAELGRRRMTVRELLALTPGSVIELDRAAGSPVDVLVNGTLIARGEVVVIDEEFGIRISEIVDREHSVVS